MYKIGEKFLITTDNWFYAPDGNNYKAVWGTIKGIKSDKESLGISTNRGSTNWYLEIGNMNVAGCQIHFAIKCDSFSTNPPSYSIDWEGKSNSARSEHTRIYNADIEWSVV